MAHIQSAGTAVFAADTALKSAVKEYATQIEGALASNPFDVGNDALFEEWKNVACLSQAVSRIEQELRQIFDAAAQITSAKQIAAPTPHRISTDPVSLISEVTATDVVAKSSTGRPSGNSLLVLGALLTLLTESEFREINISAVAMATGVAQGSMAATLKRLIRDGYLLEASKGQYKLTGRG
ncbi:MAG: hypothetical protein CFE43_16990 [Burkholderiales bacterium PBB3]|nr:MAG: hypothetical protein CFE43_16990 [Burkholderiales bacterium PBB3]